MKKNEQRISCRILFWGLRTTETQVRISAGAFWKQLPEVVTYEASIPLVYQTWWSETLISEVVTPIEGPCQASFSTYKGFVNASVENWECDLSNTLHDLGKAFEKEANALYKTWGISQTSPPKYPVINNINKSKRALEFVGEAFAWCCGVATQRKLDSLAMDEDKLKRKLGRLQHGLTASLQNLGKDSTSFRIYEEQVAENFKIINDHLHQLENGGYNERFSDTLSSTQNHFEKTSLRALWHVSQNLRKIISVSRALKTYTIINACKQHQIPPTVLHPDVLQKDLVTLQNELKASNHFLAISIHDLTRYFHLPICDCTVSKNLLTVSVKIPISQAPVPWNLVELVTTPFKWKNQTCTIMHSSIYLAVLESNSNTFSQIRAITGTSLHQCRPYHDKLCHIPRFSSDTYHGPLCAIQMYKGASGEELARICEMTCHPSTSLIITETAEDEYMLAHPIQNTTIECPQSTSPLPQGAYTTPGAIEIHLPCSCSVQVNKEILIPSRYPCDGAASPSAQVTHILPAMWTHLASVQLFPKFHKYLPTYGNIGEIINQNWSLTIPHLNLSTTRESTQTIINSLGTDITKDEDPSNFLTLTMIVLIIWNLLLSFTLLLVMFNRSPLLIAAQVQGAQALLEDSNEKIIFTTAACLATVFFFLLMLWLYLNHRQNRTTEGHDARKNTEGPHVLGHISLNNRAQTQASPRPSPRTRKPVQAQERMFQ